MSVKVANPLLQLPVRSESTNAQDARKAALEVKDSLQKDWDAKVLTYEELKPRTLQPSPVCVMLLSCAKVDVSLFRMHT